MAYRRSISARATIVARQYSSSFSYVLHNDDHKHHPQNESPSPQATTSLFHQRPFGSSMNKSTGFGGLTCYRRCSQVLLPTIGSSFHQKMSTTIGGGSEKISIVSDVAGVLGDTSVEAVASQAPAVNEVTVAAADSFFPVAALQHIVDTVHSFTGFNWWASIMLTTVVIRGAMLPLLINQLKSTSKLAIMRPRLEEIKEEMQEKGMDPRSVAEGQSKMKKLFEEYGVSPFTPLKGIFIQGPLFISFFLAITNMAEKVPSFKAGGNFWFLDLTTPDELYILPVLTAMTFWITVECNAQEGMEGNPQSRIIKNVMRALAVVSVPLTAGFPKAIFCYWVPSNLFSLVYGLVLKRPGVKKFLGVPEVPSAPPSHKAPLSMGSLLSSLKNAAAEGQKPPLQQAKPVNEETSSTLVRSQKPPLQKTKPVNGETPSTFVLNQKLKTLEKQVKGRKKNKKRSEFF